MTSPDELHAFYMEQALREAEAAGHEDEVPIGAVIVHEPADGSGPRVIGSAHNQREQLRDPTAHAEMLAITQAAEALGNWRLERCTLYVTLEPCPMWRARSCWPAFRAWCTARPTRRRGRRRRCFDCWTTRDSTTGRK